MKMPMFSSIHVAHDTMTLIRYFDLSVTISDMLVVFVQFGYIYVILKNKRKQKSPQNSESEFTSVCKRLMEMLFS